MNTSSNDDPSLPEICALFSGMLGTSVSAVERVGGGKNARIYKVSAGDRHDYAAKFYLHRPSDNRDRLRVEFKGLTFLWNQGVRCVPRPIASDSRAGCGIYEFVEGRRIQAQEITRTDIDSAVEFLGMLKDLTRAHGSADLCPASEACFSIKSILLAIESRLERLHNIGPDTGEKGELGRFLAKEFEPATKTMWKWVGRRAGETGTSLDQEIPTEERTLSPSDFGFHNAMRRGDGSLVFLDFEYFGWDDPAKMIADVILHPGMELTEEHRREFVGKVVARLSGLHALSQRLEIAYPLFGLKWCTILLNEFLRDDAARRKFVGAECVDLRDLRNRQLDKARLMLNRVSEQYQAFPYL